MVGAPGAWDDAYAAHGSIVRNADGTWDLWYGGGRTASSQGIGHAASPDGIAWTRDPANPLTDLGCSAAMPPTALGCPGAWDEARNYTPVVLARPGGSDCSAPALITRSCSTGWEIRSCWPATNPTCGGRPKTTI